MWLQRLHCDIPSGGRQTSCHLALIRLRRPLNGGLQRDCNCQQRADLDEADDFAQLNLIFVPNLANPFYKQAFMLACLPSFVCGLGSDLSAAFRGHILGALLPPFAPGALEDGSLPSSTMLSSSLPVAIRIAYHVGGALLTLGACGHC